jgi:hypothetical protein
MGIEPFQARLLASSSAHRTARSAEEIAIFLLSQIFWGIPECC